LVVATVVVAVVLLEALADAAALAVVDSEAALVAASEVLKCKK